MNHHHQTTPLGFWVSGTLALTTQMIGRVAADAADFHVVASNVSVTLTILISTVLLAGMVLNLCERVTGWPPKRKKDENQ